MFRNARYYLPLLTFCFGSSFNAAGEGIPAEAFNVPEGLEVSVWATTPMFYNPTNMDIDQDGRIWVTEAVNYRLFKNDLPLKHQKGDRVVVLEDTDGDGKADSSHVFVQDQDLVAPLGIGVIGNRILVASAPSMILYTDVDNNRVFDPAIDTKEIWLTGFGGLDHDHSLHSLTAGPDGWWYFNVGNAGPHIVTDKSGWTLRSGNVYNGGTPHMGDNKPRLVSDDGRIWTGGVAFRIRPDGTGLEPIGHNFRNSYEQTVTSFGDVFQNDNDDPPACRTTWLMEYGNLGFFSEDGSRIWNADQRPDQSIPTAQWRQEDPGTIPAGDVYGAGAPCGIAYYENGALPAKYDGLLLSCESAMGVVYGYLPKPKGAGFELERFDFLWPRKDSEQRGWFRPTDVSVGTDGAIYVSDWYDPGVGGHDMNDTSFSGTIYRIAPRETTLDTPSYDLETVEGQIAALGSPAVNVRYLGFEKLAVAGEGVLPQLEALMADKEMPHLSSRAVWIAARSEKGAVRVREMLAGDPDPQRRILAFRALRRAGHDVVALAEVAVKDVSQAVRREALLALRNVDFSAKKDLLVQFAAGYDGKDRWYLEAFGTACENHEAEVYALLKGPYGNEDPLAWDARFEGLAWRLHPPEARDAFLTRAMADALPIEIRRRAMTALAFVETEEAAQGIVQLANTGPADLQFTAIWWANNPHYESWKAYGLPAQVPALPNPEETKRLDVKALLAFQAEMKDHLAYSSPLLKKSDMAEIDIDIAGAHELYLVVDDGGDGAGNDWGDWVMPRLQTGERTIRLDRFAWVSASSGWGRVNVNKDTGGGNLVTTAGPAEYGIGTHANSIIRYDLRGKEAERFRAHVGINANQQDTAASVRFQVYAVHQSPDNVPTLPAMAEVAKLQGDPVRGKQLFFDRAGCHACHSLENEGGKVGPDLTGIGKKYVAELILKSIMEPSADIALGFDSWTIETDDFDSITGFLVADGDPIILKDANATEHRIPLDTVTSRVQSPGSIMLSAEQLLLGGQDVADLVAYLAGS